ncbi:MAG TPA: carboxypeptidase-like regulatory domain-containing protein [Candidatus Polarisedimenticolaceae bacterium]|nr:carboxypeptidase-like regulatory domain-containing protein [Candidatus Polarisedimenticolaceae bacterium]
MSMLAAAGLLVELIVLGPDGAPAPDVAVSCTRGPAALVLTDAQGRATLPEGCREATCMRGGLLPGVAALQPGPATCALGYPVSLRGAVTLPSNREGVRYQVLAREAGRRQAGGSASLSDGRFWLDALRPGTYRLEVRRTDGWTCSTEPGRLEAGEHEAHVNWRDPTAVTGIVRDARGRPFPKVLLQVVYDEDAAAEGVRCAPDPAALDVVSDAGGRFTARGDGARTFRIVAHPAWQPATVELDPP